MSLPAQVEAQGMPVIAQVKPAVGQGRRRPGLVGQEVGQFGSDYIAFEVGLQQAERAALVHFEQMALDGQESSTARNSLGPDHLARLQVQATNLEGAEIAVAAEDMA